MPNQSSRIIEEDLNYIVSADLPWDDLNGKTILITGANGALAAYMVETLLMLNQTRVSYCVNVIGLVRNAEKAWARFAGYRNRADFQLIIQDISLPFAVAEPVDVIIHAASQASPKYYGVDPVGTLSANVFGTKNLLELAREKRSQNVLFFSSSEVYGQGLSPEVPIAETTYGWIDPCHERSCYAESKRMGETMCVSWHHQFGTPIKIVRPFHTYGPGMSLDDGRVYADFVANIVQSRNITMTSDGRAMRAFCYVADATVGFFTVLLKGQSGQVYNIGSDLSETSVADLANMLVGLFPEKQLQVIRAQSPTSAGYLPSQVSRIRPNIAKARNLGWHPETSLENGFRRTVESFRKYETC